MLYLKDIQEKDQAAAQKESNRWNGFFTLLGASLAGLGLAAVEIFTAGLATPLVIGASAFIVSDATDGITQLQSGNNYGINSIRSAAELSSKKITGSKTSGDIIYGLADAATGIYTGSEVTKAFSIVNTTNGIIENANATNNIQKSFYGAQIVNNVPINANGATVGSVTQDYVYDTSFAQWHNVALSSTFSHSFDVVNDIYGVQGTMNDVVTETNGSMIADIRKNTVSNVSSVFANQEKQRSSLAKVIGK